MVQQKGGREEEEGYMPISLLHPYKQDWSIKARVTRKGDLREWKNARSSGWLFSADLIDRFSTEITATFYNEAAKLYHPILEQDQVYTFADGRVCLNKSRQYNKPNDHTLSFDQGAKIVKETGDCGIKNLHLNLTRLGAVSQITDPNTPSFDVLGVVVDEGSLGTINLKAGGTKEMRKVLMLDQDKVALEL